MKLCRSNSHLFSLEARGPRREGVELRKLGVVVEPQPWVRRGADSKPIRTENGSGRVLGGGDLTLEIGLAALGPVGFGPSLFLHSATTECRFGRFIAWTESRTIASLNFERHHCRC
jgi:hypothetical protein